MSSSAPLTGESVDRANAALCAELDALGLPKLRWSFSKTFPLQRRVLRQHGFKSWMYMPPATRPPKADLTRHSFRWPTALKDRWCDKRFTFKRLRATASLFIPRTCFSLAELEAAWPASSRLWFFKKSHSCKGKDVRAQTRARRRRCGHTSGCTC
jgi:hypothetical protein